MKVGKRNVFLILILISLFIIFFLGKSFDAKTGKSSFVITGNGVSQFRKGLDVSGGTRLVYKINYDKYEKIYTNATELAAIKKTIENIIMKNIDGRISKLGVSDYKSYIQNLDNQHYIVVEIGGIADLDQAKEIIGKTLELEFKLQNKENPTKTSIAERKKIALGLLKEVEINPIMMKQITEGRMSENIYYNFFTGGTLDQLPEIYKNNIKILNKIGSGKLYNGILEGKYTVVQSESALGVSTGIELKGRTIFKLIDKQEIQGLSGKKEMVYQIEDIFIQDRETWAPAIDKNNNVLNGAYFKFAQTSSSQIGEPVVAINLDDKGKEIFCNITEVNIGNPMAIFVGGNLLTAPTIQSKICGGSAQIDGKFTTDTAKELVNNLNEGTLPAPLILMQEEKISPSLGDSALSSALWAGLIGLVAIAILMWAMYGVKKMILTMLVMLSFISLLFAFIKLSDYALSLSGIAAIILAIGMGVDANVLIYERLREEIKEGKSYESSIDHAKERSRPAIRDGQISTGLIAFLLFTMGINMFKGFGSMIIVTMFLTLLFNVPLTKELLHMFYDKK